MIPESTKYKILFIASPWLGGSGTVAFRMAEELSKYEGVEVHFVSYEMPFKDNGPGKIKYHLVKPLKYPLFPFPLYEMTLAEEVARIAVQENIDIIHAHYGVLFGHAAVLAKNICSKAKDVKLVITFHGSDVLGFDINNPGGEVTKYLNEWSIEQSDCATVASQSLKDTLKQIYSFTKDVEIVPNFLDNNLFKPSKEQLQLNNPTLIHYSNYREVKQPMVVIKTFEYAQKVIPNLKMKFIGDGPLLQSLQEYVEMKKLANVEFMGKIKNEDELACQLGQSHVLLLPSLYENFPLSALEALSCGVPVVGSNRGGIPELVIDGHNGFTHEAKDYKDMGNAVLKILRNQECWQKFSENAVSSVSEFRTDKVMRQYYDIYRTLLFS